MRTRDGSGNENENENENESDERQTTDRMESDRLRLMTWHHTHINTFNTDISSALNA